jgi:hypothetical protein
MILDNTLELLSLQEYDKGHISRIQKDMEILKSIDEASYNEILHIFEYFQSLVYSSYQKEYLTAKLHFASLRYPDIPESDWSFPLNGFTLFS